MVMQGVPNRPAAMRRRCRQLLALGWLLILTGVALGILPGMAGIVLCGSQGASCGGTPLLVLLGGAASVVAGIVGLVSSRKYE